MNLSVLARQRLNAGVRALKSNHDLTVTAYDCELKTDNSRDNLPSKSASMVVMNDDRTQVLLIKRHDFRIWALPAGGIEKDETADQAAIRETYEETGYRVEIERYLGEYWRPGMPKGGDLMQVYVGRVSDDTPDEHGWESVAVEWFGVTELPWSVTRSHREIIADTLTNHSRPVKKTQQMSQLASVMVKMAIGGRNVWNRIRGQR